MAALLAAGGVIAGASLAGSPAGSTSLTGSTSAAGPPAGEAAALNATLNAADSPGAATLASAAPSSPSSTAAVHPCARVAQAAKAAGVAGPARRCWVLRHRLLRLALVNGIDGQFTFKTANGVKTVAFQRGTVLSVSSSDIVVRDADGNTWTWDLVSTTVVREHGAKTQQSALATGQAVWVGGPVVSGAKDARLIVIRPPASSPSATPSSAS